MNAMMAYWSNIGASFLPWSLPSSPAKDSPDDHLLERQVAILKRGKNGKDARTFMPPIRGIAKPGTGKGLTFEPNKAFGDATDVSRRKFVGLSGGTGPVRGSSTAKATLPAGKETMLAAQKRSSSSHVSTGILAATSASFHRKTRSTVTPVRLGEQRMPPVAIRSPSTDPAFRRPVSTDRGTNRAPSLPAAVTGNRSLRSPYDVLTASTTTRRNISDRASAIIPRYTPSAVSKSPAAKATSVIERSVPDRDVRSTGNFIALNAKAGQADLPAPARRKDASSLTRQIPKAAIRSPYRTMPIGQSEAYRAGNAVAAAKAKLGAFEAMSGQRNVVPTRTFLDHDHQRAAASLTKPRGLAVEGSNMAEPSPSTAGSANAANGSQSSNSFIALRGEVVMEGRRIGAIMASSQASMSRLPNATQSSVNIRALPVYPGTRVPL